MQIILSSILSSSPFLLSARPWGGDIGSVQFFKKTTVV